MVGLGVESRAGTRVWEELLPVPGLKLILEPALALILTPIQRSQPGLKLAPIDKFPLSA